MDEKKIAKLRNLAFKKISTKKFVTKEEREDFAQDFVMRYLEGKSQKQDMRYAVIDYFRRVHPFSRTKEQTKKKYPNDLHDFKKLELSPLIPAKAERPDLKMDAIRILNELTREDRILFVLRYYFEFSFPELSFIFGVSENFLHKKIKVIEEQTLPIQRRKLDRVTKP